MKKLSLNRETIRVLKDSELGAVVGASLVIGTGTNCYQSNPSGGSQQGATQVTCMACQQSMMTTKVGCDTNAVASKC